MRIMMLSWEYPPKNVGGLSTHVYYLSHALSSMGNEVHVVTCEEGTAPVEENDKGVFIHRVEPYKLDTEDFSKWVMQLNFAMVEEASRLIRDKGRFDIIHAHDWLTAFCARVLKWSYDIPMVSTIHATEYGRNNGIKTEMQRYISSTEWMLARESWKVVICSQYMRRQVADLFSTEWDKLWVIANGVNSIDIDAARDEDLLQFRRKYAKDDEKIVFFIGRHVFEKGIHLLIDAAPKIVLGYNKIRFIIAGRGPMTDELINRVKVMGLSDKFEFPGYMDDYNKNKLYKVADAAVFPSLYEPFGIVALEAMSAGCPVVAADTGGLSEIIEHEKTGLKCLAGVTQSLEDNVLRILKDDKLSSLIKENAKTEINEKYNWNKVSNLTVDMYKTVLTEAKGTRWGTKTSTDKDNVASETEVKK